MVWDNAAGGQEVLLTIGHNEIILAGDPLQEGPTSGQRKTPLCGVGDCWHASSRQISSRSTHASNWPTMRDPTLTLVAHCSPIAS